MTIHADGILTRFCLHTQRERRGIPARDTAVRRSDSSLTYVYAPRPRITCVDREVIREYFRERGDAADALAGEDVAGLRDQRLRELPSALDEKLSKLPDGFERLWKGRDLMVIETHTGRVIDFMRGVRPEN